ncbi:MAG: DUF1080 domain-containing protein [Verrucomicrobiota bacterium]
MKKQLAPLIAALLCLPLITLAADTAIFNGKNLDGWHADPEDTAKDWSVKDGMIVGDNPGKNNSVLWTDTDHADFELTLEYQTDSEDYDSGVFVRGKTHQVQIGVSRSLKRDLTGCIYAPKDDRGKYPAETDKVESVHKLGEWNKLRIVATGKRIQTFLNDESFVDYEAVVIPDSGKIGLQLHAGVHQTMRFRNLVYKPLNN